MPTYEAVVMIGNKPTHLRLEAASQAEGMKQLRRRGRVVSIKRKMFGSIETRLTPPERFTFLLKLATMVSSRVSMGRALELIAQTFGGTVSRVATRMAEKVNSGTNFIAVLESEEKHFPRAVIALVRAGFATGKIAEALREAAEFEQMIQSTYKGSMNEIWLGIGYFAAAAALTWSTVDYFGPMVTDNPLIKDAALQTQMINDAAFVFMVINIAMLVGILALLLLATLGRLALPLPSDRLITRMPYFRDVVLGREYYTTLKKLSLLLTSGVRIEEALRITLADLPRGALFHDMTAAVGAIHRGQPWAPHMRVLDETDRASLTASTNREDVARTFGLLADQFRDLYAARLKVLAPAMNILAAMFMTVSTLVLFGLTMLPMLMFAAEF